MYRWLSISCFCLLVLLSACGSASATQASTASPGPITIKVAEGDYYIQSPVTTFTVGVKYHFIVTNHGTHHHDFLVMHPGETEMLTMDQVYQRALVYIYNVAPGQTKTLDFTFTHIAPTGMLELACHYGQNEHQLLFFSDNGTYIITCKQFPHEHLTVVVQDS